MMLMALVAAGAFAMGGCQDWMGPGSANQSNSGTASQGSPGTGNGGTIPDGTSDPGSGGGANPGDGGGTSPSGGTSPGTGGGGAPAPVGTSLTGTWSGNVNYQVSTRGVAGLDVTTPVDRATDITFDTLGKPNTLTIYLTEAPLVYVDVPRTDHRWSVFFAEGSSRVVTGRRARHRTYRNRTFARRCFVRPSN